jgi:hypothetical protein
MTEMTFSMFSRLESRTMQSRLGLTDPPTPPQPLTEKYRPRALRDLFGQGPAVDRLRTFLEAPYSTGFVFDGETGTGKTSAALALAHELGVDLDWGLHRINSGEMDAEAVSFALKSLRFVAPGSGWKVAICDEADSMSAKAKQMWLSVLEELPVHSVVIFTTNHVGRFEQRFLDRCERITFASDAGMLAGDAQALIERVWKAEGFAGRSPAVEDLPDVVQKGVISFRRVIRAVEAAGRCRAGQFAASRPTRPDSIPITAQPPGAPSDPPGGSEPEEREPCITCRTTRGGKNSSGQYERTKGFCQSCYNKFRRKKATA